MKQVKITLEGSIKVVEYCSTRLSQGETGFHDNHAMTAGWASVGALYLDDDTRENLISQMGQARKTRAYFHDLFCQAGGHPLPIELHAQTIGKGVIFNYIIELDDAEVFDIRRVQLVVSDLEIACLPHFILAEKIIYDGREIPLRPEEDVLLNDFGIVGGLPFDKYEVTSFENGE